MEARFLTVDLEIESNAKLHLLAYDLGHRVMNMYCGPLGKQGQLLVVETIREYPNPDANIEALCEVVDQLPRGSRRVLAQARKEIHIGYELNPAEVRFRLALRPETVQRVARIGACLAVTCYHVEPDGKSTVLKPARTKTTAERKRRG